MKAKNFLLIGLIGLTLSSVQADLPQVTGKALTDKDVFDPNLYKKIGDAPGSGLSRIFWDQQNSLQEDLQNSIGDLSIGLPDLDYDITDNFKFRIKADLSPRHRVYRVNTGFVDEGVPQANAESYYIVIDQHRAKLETRFYFKDLKKNFNFFVEPIGLETTEVVRKLTPVRNMEEYNRKFSKNKTSDIERFLVAENEDKKTFGERFKKSLEWTYGAIAYGYDQLGKLVQAGSNKFSDEEATKLFFMSPFEGVKIKQRMFDVNSKNFLENIKYDEVFSVVRYMKTGVLGAGIGKADVWLGFEPNIKLQTERSARRVPVKDCKNKIVPGLEGEEASCMEVELKLTYLVEKGTEWELSYEPGLGPFNLNIMDWHRKKYSFREIEHVYRFDLSKEEGQKQFDRIYDEYEIRETDWKNLPFIQRSDAVEVVKTGWRGHGDDHGNRIMYDASLQLGVYKRRGKSKYEAYPMCMQEVVEGVEQPEVCNFMGSSSKNRKFYNNIKWFVDNESNRVGLETIVDGLEESKAANLHFLIEYLDRKAEKKKLVAHDYYDRLNNIKLALAIDQLPELYKNENLVAIKKRIEALENKNRNVKNSLQNMTLDIFMNREYTKTVINKDPAVVNGAIEQLPVSGLVKASLRKAFLQIKLSNDSKKAETLLKLYNDKGRKPYFANLMMVLGKDHLKHIEEGNLAIKFNTEASDLKEGEKYFGIKVGDVRSLEKVIFIPKGDFSDPDRGHARITNVVIWPEKESLKTGNPKFILEFNSNLMGNYKKLPLVLTGTIAKFDTILADEDVAKIEIKDLRPVEFLRKNSQFKYRVELSDLAKIGITDLDGHVIEFRLEDPSLDSELPSRRLTETVEVGINL